MRRPRPRFRFGAGLTLGLMLAAAAMPARAINVLPFGDSITVGWGSTDTTDLDGDFNATERRGGYRYYLDGLLDPSFNFIGNRNHDSADNGSHYDVDYWGQAGAKAQHDNGFDTGFNVGIASLLRATHNITQSGAPATYRAFTPGSTAATKVDGVLLMIGTNSNLANTTAVNNAYNEISALMHGGNVNATGSGLGNITGATGLKAQMASTAVANSGAHVFVAGILPGTYNAVHNHANTVAYTNATADYNARLRNTLLPTLTGTATSYHYVDMFAVRVGELNLAWLADLFTGGNQQSLINTLSPESDGPIDYVDWVRGGWNEATWDEGLSGAAQSPTATASVNLDLIPDRVHPNNLGYAIIANVWFNAMQSAGLGGMGWLTGDANNDGIVDNADLITVEQRFGATAPAGAYLWGDANGDGVVNGADILTIERNWGSTWSAPIPEPATAAVLFAGAMHRLGARRRV